MKRNWRKPNSASRKPSGSLGLAFRWATIPAIALSRVLISSMKARYMCDAFSISANSGSAMADNAPISDDDRRDELLRKVLATPPISNEDIVRKARESRVQSGGNAAS